jgi:penicillin-binding protein 2B
VTASKLSVVIGMTQDDILSLLNKKGQFQVEFGKYVRDLSLDKKNEIELMRLLGILLIQSVKRYYPNGFFASHLIGFTDSETKKGKVNSKRKNGN